MENGKEFLSRHKAMHGTLEVFLNVSFSSNRLNGTLYFHAGSNIDTAHIFADACH